MSTLATPKELLVEQLKDLYSAEGQLVNALPRLEKAAHNEELKEAFQTHLEQTEEHVDRLEIIMKGLDESPRGKKCKGMEGLIEEGKEVLENDGASEVIDLALIAAAQRVEHYEIAAYGCARSLAESLGDEKTVKILQKTLDEEGQTDKLLTDIATRIQPHASEVDVDE